MEKGFDMPLGLRSLFTEPRFDWYQVTFHENVQAMKVLESAYEYFEDCSMQVAERVEVKQYKRAVDAFWYSGLERERLFHFCIGGSGGDRPHIKSTGKASHFVYEWLSKHWQGCYGVSRADVCFDTVEPQMFDLLNAEGVKFGKDQAITLDRAGDWDLWERGATRYMGSGASQALCRIYEKGKQLHGNPDWVRLEFQIRPSKAEGKRKAAAMNPEQLARSISWVHTFLQHLMYASWDVKPADDLSYQQISYGWQPTDKQLTLIALVEQYGNILEQVANAMPAGWHDVGLVLEAMREVHKTTGKAKGGLGLNPYSSILSRVLVGNKDFESVSREAETGFIVKHLNVA